MKGLLLILLALALGSVLVFVALDSGGRDSRAGRALAPAEARSQRDPADTGDPAPPREAIGPDIEAQRRQSLTTGAAPGSRGIFEGVVVGDGRPIQGAALELLQRDAVLVEASTDERGRFRLDSKPLTENGTLRIHARGFASLERALPARPGGGTVLLGNLRLLRGQTLVGQVLDGRGKGIPDVTLRAEPPNQGSDVHAAQGRSGPDGRFEILEAPQGTVVVTARARGYGEQVARHTAGSPPLVIRMEPGAEMTVLVHTPRGRPVAGAEVLIQSQGDAQPQKRVGQSDEQGRVHFEGLGAPVWTVRVTHPDYRTAGRSQVRADGTEERVECTPWPAIEGVVRTSGGQPPPPGTRVRALPASAPGDRVGAVEGGLEVAPDGHFRMSGLRAGDWRIHATAPGFAPSLSPPVKLGIEGDGYVGTIELQAGGKLEFQVTMDGTPVAGAEIELFPSLPSPAQLWALSQSRGTAVGRRVTTSTTGRGVLENLSAGMIWVAVFAESCPPTASGPHAVEHGSPSATQAEPVAIQIQRGCRVRGRVLGKGGKPAPRAQIRIVETAGSLGFPLTLACGEDGSYTSAWLPAGGYVVEAFAADDPAIRSGSHPIELEPGEQHQLDLDL